MSKSMKKYNHAFTIAFTIDCNHPTGDDVTASEFRKAILLRLAGISDDEFQEAVGLPFDTYEKSPKDE